ncbi:Transposase [Vibrio sp. B1ASS3]|nr:Transposase [Vibrio sp. B1ASS3]CAE6949262.1 Transposase [Vibrio sp. B1ASS3]
MKALFQWLAEQDIKLPPSLVAELISIHEHYKYLNEQISTQDRKLKAITENNENAELLKSIPGVGDLTATLCVANISSPSNLVEVARWPHG